jgi:acyl carrier protein
MTDTAARPVDASEIQGWIIDRLVREMNVDASTLNPDKRLMACGVDSLQMISLVGQLEEWLGCRFTSNPLERYPSISALSRFIADQIAQGRTTLDPSSS